MRGGDLLVGHSAEIMQLDDLRQPRLELHQVFQRIVQRHDVDFHAR